MLVLASQFTATSRLRSQEYGHGSGYASGSTGLETIVAGYGSLTEPGNLFVLMPMLLGINIEMKRMLCLDGMCQNSEHARLGASPAYGLVGAAR